MFRGQGGAEAYARPTGPVCHFSLHHMLGVRPTLRLVRPFSTARSLPRMSPLPKSEKEWRAILSPEQFRILRQKGTERAGTGEYNKHYDTGVYQCAGCAAPLYKSTTKFDSGCGWPAFFDAIPGAIDRHDDFSFGMVCAGLCAHRAAAHGNHLHELWRPLGARLLRRRLSYTHR